MRLISPPSTPTMSRDAAVAAPRLHIATALPISLLEVSHNHGAPTEFPENGFTVRFIQSPENFIRDFDQMFSIPDQQFVSIDYDRETDQSTIIAWVAGGRETRQVVVGIVLLSVQTNRGNIDTVY